MKVLVIGSGGREHALVWKISQSKRVTKVFAAPGNPGMADLAEIVNIKSTDLIDLAEFAKEKGIHLTVVGPEEPLNLGIVDEFNRQNLRIFGPSQKASKIESSKSFAKEFMKKNNIPTAAFVTFSSPTPAREYLSGTRFPKVIKADGLAGGKGVYVCQNSTEADKAIQEIMVEQKFGKSGDEVIIEDFLVGKELSFMVISDGRRILPLVTSMDYKKAQENDRGKNTGGMGAISPAPQINKNLYNIIMKTIIEPTISGLRYDGREFKGVLYAGLMITAEGPKVLEYNCRFGDPETQPVLMRLKSDLVDILEAVTEEYLIDIHPEWDENVAACVVLVSKGYPGKYESGKKIDGLQRAKSQGVDIFHAGTYTDGKSIYSNGGRVLNVCASGETLKSTMKKIYDAISLITFDNVNFRKDIGWSKK